MERWEGKRLRNPDAVDSGICRQPGRAYANCYGYACGLANALYVPPVCTHCGAGKRFLHHSYSHVDGNIVCLYRANRRRSPGTGGHCACSRGRENGLGAVPAHSVEDVRVEGHARKMWPLNALGVPNVPRDLSLPSLHPRTRLTANRQEATPAVGRARSSDGMARIARTPGKDGNG